jgi:hypothetical protein
VPQSHTSSFSYFSSQRKGTASSQQPSLSTIRGHKQTNEQQGAYATTKTKQNKETQRRRTRKFTKKRREEEKPKSLYKKKKAL